MISQHYFGKYTGVVKDNADDDNLGKIWVTVPSIFPPDQKVQARAALPYGHYFVPESGAFVWIEFEGGDPALPLWTGIQVLRSADWPSAAAVKPPQKRVLATAAGHTVTFDDKSGEESIEVVDGVNKHDIKLDKQGVAITDGVNNHSVTTSGSGISIKTQSGAKVELTASGVTVDAGGGTVMVNGSTVILNGGALPVARLTDQGIGNLGAPVVITLVGNPTVLA